MNDAEKYLRDKGKGISWRKKVPCPECGLTSYETCLLIPYKNVSDWSRADIYCPHCGYPHREKEENENPDKPKI